MLARALLLGGLLLAPLVLASSTPDPASLVMTLEGPRYPRVGETVAYSGSFRVLEARVLGVGAAVHLPLAGREVQLVRDGSVTMATGLTDADGRFLLHATFDERALHGLRAQSDLVLRSPTLPVSASVPPGPPILEAAQQAHDWDKVGLAWSAPPDDGGAPVFAYRPGFGPTAQEQAYIPWEPTPWDGNTASAQVRAPGSYVATLAAINEHGLGEVAEIDVVVHAPPHADVVMTSARSNDWLTTWLPDSGTMTIPSGHTFMRLQALVSGRLTREGAPVAGEIVLGQVTWSTPDASAVGYGRARTHGGNFTVWTYAVDLATPPPGTCVPFTVDFELYFPESRATRSTAFTLCRGA